MTFGADNIYKWIDANGKVHFSDKAPAKEDALTVEESNIELGNIDNSYPSVDPNAASDERRSAQALRDKQLARWQQKESFRRQCFATRKRVSLISRPVEYFDDDGKRIHVTEKERQAEEFELKSFIRKNCQS